MAEVPQSDSMQVTIFGRTYHLKGAESRDDLTELAALVDRRMREVHESSGTPDTLNVAILACLNLADDYLEARRNAVVPTDAGTQRRLVSMVRVLDEALAE